VSRSRDVMLCYLYAVCRANDACAPTSAPWGGRAGAGWWKYHETWQVAALALAAPALGVAATFAAVTSRAALLSAALASAPATPTRGLLRCSHPLGAAKQV
jgi:hypothetical protein